MLRDKWAIELFPKTPTWRHINIYILISGDVNYAKSIINVSKKIIYYNDYIATMVTFQYTKLFSRAIVVLTFSSFCSQESININAILLMILAFSPVENWLNLGYPGYLVLLTSTGSFLYCDWTACPQYIRLHSRVHISIYKEAVVSYKFLKFPTLPWRVVGCCNRHICVPSFCLCISGKSSSFTT